MAREVYLVRCLPTTLVSSRRFVAQICSSQAELAKHLTTHGRGQCGISLTLNELVGYQPLPFPLLSRERANLSFYQLSRPNEPKKVDWLLALLALKDVPYLTQLQHGTLEEIEKLCLTYDSGLMADSAPA